MINKVNNFNMNQQYANYKNLQNTSFKGLATILCEDTKKCPDFLDKCRRFCERLMMRESSVSGKGSTFKEKGIFVMKCAESFNDELENLTKTFTKNNQLGFEFDKNI